MNTLHLAVAVLTGLFFQVNAADAPFTARLVEPFYPAKKKIPEYAAPASDAGKTIQLKDGLKISLGDLSKVRSLDGEWKISGLEASAKAFDDETDLDKGFQKSEFDDSKWESISVPLDWYQKYPQFRKEGKPPFVKGWYRKTLNVGKSETGKRALLTFDVAGYEAALFVNGKCAGSHHGDFTGWTVDVTEHLKFGGDNVLALRVFSDFGPKWGAGDAKHVYGAQWSISSIKGGLWQSARFSFEAPVHLRRVLISSDLEKSALNLDYLIVNTGSETKTFSLRAGVFSDPKSLVSEAELGKVSCAPGETKGRVRFPAAALKKWSPDQPHLYQLCLALVSGTEVLSGRTERFGFRDFKIKGNSFYLNGERTYLFGENLPVARYGGTSKVPDEEVAKVAEVIRGFRSQGYNMLRTAHMPVPPFILDIADQLGMMIYDEWGWTFTDRLDPNQFGPNNLSEVKEWVHRDHNHASVVMWSAGNEVHYDTPLVEKELNQEVAHIRALDPSERPVSVFSGAAFGYGKNRLDTDFLDLHTYMSLAPPAWSKWEWHVDQMFSSYINPVYGEGGVFKKPFVLWECVGFSWGAKSDPYFAPGSIESYLRYATNDTSWGQPNVVGFSGMLGIAAALDPARGNSFGQETYGKRIIELVRRDLDHFQGFAPWFQNSTTPAAALWNQPVYVGLRTTNGLAPRNLFEGRRYDAEVFVANSSPRSQGPFKTSLTLVGLDGKSREIGAVSIDSIGSFTRTEKAVAFSIPAGLAPGFYQIRLVLTQNDIEVSRNFYDIFLGSQSALTQPIAASKKIGVLSSDESATESALKSLGLNVSTVKEKKDLAACQCLIVPTASKPNPLFRDEAFSLELKNWIRAGGSLLILEQEYSGLGPLDTATLKKENTLADIIVTGHPIFQGLVRENFETWDHPDHGFVVRFPSTSFTPNALAARGSFLGERGLHNIISESTFGSGHILQSQLSATALWGIDSSATLYLRNLFSYIAGGEKPFASAKPWEEARRDYRLARGSAESFDLKPFANMGFKDETADDQKGGWTDQGENDFRNMPLGRQVLAGVPFDIIDPARNSGNSCIVLSNTAKTFLPDKVEGIKVDGHFRKLFFLHAMAWSSPKVGEYRIRYEDGKTERVVLENGRNINDWWSPIDLPQALLGIVKENKLSQGVGLWVMPWENPRTEVKIISLDFVSYGKALPILVGVTGEKGSTRSLAIDDGTADIIWSVTVDGKGEKPSAARVDKKSEPLLPRGESGARIDMPAQTKEGTPAVFTRFDKKALDPSHRYLSFWIKSSADGGIHVALPKSDWKSYLAAQVPLRKSDVWKKIELDLSEDMGLKSKDWKLTDLRGEIFIYNRQAPGHGDNPAVSFVIDGMKLE